MPELKPCPFCGSKAKLKSWTNQFGHRGWSANCTNDNCYARISYGEDCDSDYVRDLWNKRQETTCT